MLCCAGLNAPPLPGEERCIPMPRSIVRDVDTRRHVPRTDLLLADPRLAEAERRLGRALVQVERLEAGGTAARRAGAGAGSDNASGPSRVPQNWQNTTSGPLMFPQRPHLVMSKGFATSRIL